MFTESDIKRIVGGDVELTRDLVDGIELWDDMLKGNAPWNNRAPSLGIESGICREFADISINEMEDILHKPLSLEEKSKLLIECANEAGGEDNISVILVDLTNLQAEGEQ